MKGLNPRGEPGNTEPSIIRCRKSGRCAKDLGKQVAGSMGCLILSREFFEGR